MPTYGTIHSNGHAEAGVGAGMSEHSAHLADETKKAPALGRLRKHFNDDVSQNYGDIILLSCYVITGLLDSCATAVWGSFVSMQTGNTVYIGLGLADPHNSTRWVKSGTSLLMFCFGSFCFARFHRYLGPQKRWVLITSFLIQLLLIVGAALITQFASKSDDGNHDLHWYVLLPLGMIGFQSSGQAVTSRVLKYGSLTSVVLTSIYCDLFSDPLLLAWPTENPERNRRFAAPVLLLIGALCGGLLAKSEFTISAALWTAAGLKGLIVISWLIWPKDPAADDETDV